MPLIQAVCVDGWALAVQEAPQFSLLHSPVWRLGSPLSPMYVGGFLLLSTSYVAQRSAPSSDLLPPYEQEAMEGTLTGIAVQWIKTEEACAG